MNGVFKDMEHHTVAISHLMTWRRHGVSACWSLRRAEILIPRRGIQDPIRFHVGSCMFFTTSSDCLAINCSFSLASCY